MKNNYLILMIIRTIVFFASLLFFVSLMHGQSVYFTSNPFEADYRLYVTDNQFEADWHIYQTDNRYNTGGGVWFATDNRL